VNAGSGDVEMATKNSSDDNDLLRLMQRDDVSSGVDEDESDEDKDDSDSSSEEGNVLLPQNEALRNDGSEINDYFNDYAQQIPPEVDDTFMDTSSARQRRHGNGNSSHQNSPASAPRRTIGSKKKSKKKKSSNATQRPMLPLGLADPNDAPRSMSLYDLNIQHCHYDFSSKFSGNFSLLASPSVSRYQAPTGIHRTHPQAQMSFRAGILWLFIITLGISAMSDILVDTIDGFAQRLHISEVFTSMIIVPFFSNVAEQVSAVLFAYRNEMDLCVGVTVGSAIQVASFVLPGCVIIGWLVDRSMTLYFHAYETVCLFLAVVVIAAVLQGGTTNWLVGATCISVYTMIATGFWFHSLEDLSVDAESYGQNSTRR
jgi:Ca2+/Na+ antiporter